MTPKERKRLVKAITVYIMAYEKALVTGKPGYGADMAVQAIMEIIDKQYRDWKGDAYRAVCGELAKTIERARTKGGELVL